MKRIFDRFFVFMVSVAALVGFTGCGDDEDDGIVGKWRLMAVVSRDYEDGVEVESDYDDYSPARFYCNFTEDGKLFISEGSFKGYVGHWTLSGTELVIYNETGGEKDDFEVYDCRINGNNMSMSSSYSYEIDGAFRESYEEVKFKREN